MFVRDVVRMRERDGLLGSAGARASWGDLAWNPWLAWAALLRGVPCHRG